MPKELEVKDVVSKMNLAEVRGAIDERRKKLDDLFADAGPDSQNLDMTTEQVDEARALNDELTELGNREQALTEMAGIRASLSDSRKIDRQAIHPTSGKDGARQVGPSKSLGEMFVESAAYQQRVHGGTGPESLIEGGVSELRAATMTTAAGWAPESVRVPGLVVPSAMRPIQIIDLIPPAQTSQAAVVYMEETTATNAAAERAENAAYPESTLVFTQRSKTVRSVGTSLPITDEQLDDVAQCQSYVDGRLMFFVRQRVDSQILNGNDVAPNIAGILNHADLQTQAKATDPVPDAVYKAATKVRVTGRAFPNAYITHPNDWQEIRLLRTADGVYIWGSPSEAGPERIWGLLVVQSDAIAENTGLVGDFSAAMIQLYERRGIEVQVGYVNDDFLDGRQTVRAGLRCANVIYRGAAYCTVTGI